MSRTSRNSKQKGRKHRRVNRTPRPVTPVGRRRDGAARGPVADRTPVEAARPVATAAGPAVGAARPVAVGAQPSVGVERALAEGLSRHAQRTLTCLHDSGSRGATAEDLSEAVGFTARTVTKHLDGLSRSGLVEQRADGRWSATEPEPGPGPGPGTGTASAESPLPVQNRGAKDEATSA